MTKRRLRRGAKVARAHKSTSHRATDGGVGRCNVGPCAKINVKHGSIGAFDHDALAFGISLVDVVHTVHDHRLEEHCGGRVTEGPRIHPRDRAKSDLYLQLLRIGLVGFDFFIEVDLNWKGVLVILDKSTQFFGECIRETQVAHADSNTADFGPVGRTDTLACGTD